MNDPTLEKDLTDLVRSAFPEMTVRVEHNERWNRMSVAFTCPEFASLLPEERFNKLISLIPRDLRETRMQAFVWVELTPGESVDDYLKLPRSEDSVDKEPDVYAMLVEADFFVDLGKRMGSRPENKCAGNFAFSEAVLTSAKFSTERVRDAKLVFIRHGVYCDCQVLGSVQSELSKLYTGAA